MAYPLTTIYAKRTREELPWQFFFFLMFIFLLLLPLQSFAIGTIGTIGSEQTPPQTVLKDELMPGSESLNKPLKNRYSFFLHKRNYLLPVSYNWHPNNDLYSAVAPYRDTDSPFYGKTEAEFQISFFAPLVEDVFFENFDLLLGYTHHAWWQLYNASWSKPFRETNYAPELFFRKSIEIPNGSERKFMFVDLGYNHESNGQFESLSRSWNRIFLRSHYSAEKFLVVLSAWHRLPEPNEEDENPGIQEYYGYGDLAVFYALGKHTFDFKMPFSKSPGVEFGYSFPIKDFYRFYVNYKSGYGHSLIEYNRSIERVGIGITLEGSMDRRH